MLRTGWLVAFVCVFAASIQSAFATVRVHVDLSSQTMSVESGSGAAYTWPISSGRTGYGTPQGTYRPQRMMAVAFSAKYHNSPMPHSIFFRGGYAIHGTYEVGHLGRAASHGCIRLAPGNAATLFSLVKSEGAVISISGSAGPVYAAARHHKGGVKVASRHRHKGGTKLAAHRRHHQQGYYAYTSQGEPQPVQQWMANPAAGF